MTTTGPHQPTSPTTHSRSPTARDIRWRIYAPGTGPGDPLVDVQVDPGDCTDITIGANGSVVGRNTTTGALEDLFTLGMARFPNTEELEREGNGLFRDSPAAGEAIIDVPGGNGIGTLQAGGGSPFARCKRCPRRLFRRTRVRLCWAPRH